MKIQGLCLARDFCIETFGEVSEGFNGSDLGK